ncbi:ABC transporter permease [Paralimibaculum aggregatum]|uniref:ABC transporter permease n=1 Tax=Paralimibaculum aggregatum TaxID=3036245 RepID=A0ABQ6LSR3_9RHOB|nr:ABC transporter permease [Limibaculum sp. NKW23]GMG85130.1 ABC transporter permease [Limibaculum sp. NKW23]
MARQTTIEERVPSAATRLIAWLGYAFLLMPSLVVLPMSFGTGTEFDFPPKSFSLDLYREYFSEPSWVASTLTSLQVAAASAALSLLIGGLAAYGIVRYQFRGKKLLTIFLLSPMLVPTIVVALALYLYLGIARATGTTWGLILCHAVVCVPYVIVTMMAGLRQVDRNLEIAATIMGASWFGVLTRVTIPLLRPTILASGLFAFLISFDEVVISFFVSGVRTQTLPVKMYSTIHWEISPVLAAVSSLLTILSLGICILVAALQKER